MTDNQNIEYEKFVQDVYQTLHKVEGLETVKVNHNVKIEGKSGCKHQLDVYWEFEMVGQLHRIAIECKNYATRNVEVGKLRDFFGVLYDIGNVKGIFVSKVGYNSGAIKFADYYNISLQEARVPNVEDWKGRVKDIHFSVAGYSTRVTKRYVDLDQHWLLKNEKIKQDSRTFSFSLSGSTDELNVYDGEGRKITDFLGIEREMPQHFKDAQQLNYRKAFDEGYLDTKEMGMVKVNFIEFTKNLRMPHC